jgi:hypothetical protein
VIGTLSTVALIGAAAGRNGFAVYFRGDTDTMPEGARDARI